MSPAKPAVNYRQALIDRIGIPVEQGEVTAGGIRTAYLAAGAGPTVVCLHGAGAGAVTWYPAIVAIAQQHRVVVPDIVGYGESDKPDAAYDRPFFAGWLRDFLNELQVPEAHVVGLSQGGAIALQFALESPERVAKLVLVDSGALGAQPSFWPFIGMLWMNTLPSAAANRFVSRYLLFEPQNRDPNHGHYSVQVLQQTGGKKPFSQGRGAAVSAMSTEALGQIQTETLVIWGEDDRFFAIEQAEAAIRNLPNARLERIGNAGHLPLMDQPEVFNRMLTEFLSAD